MKITAKHKIIFTITAFVLTLTGLIIAWSLHTPQWLILALFGWLVLLTRYLKYLADYKTEQIRKKEEKLYWETRRNCKNYEPKD